MTGGGKLPAAGPGECAASQTAVVEQLGIQVCSWRDHHGGRRRGGDQQGGQVQVHPGQGLAFHRQ